MLSHENPCVTHAQQSQVLRFLFDVCKACAALLAAKDPGSKPQTHQEQHATLHT